MNITPKLSSIYNKILQLFSAVLLIVVLLNIWLITATKSQVNLQHHFGELGEKYLQQVAAGVSVLLPETQASKNLPLQNYINNIAKADFIKQVHLYDETGLLIVRGHVDSEGGVLADLSIHDLYGISVNKLDRSKRYIPFIQEIRDDKLRGYLRVTIEKSYLIADLSQENDNRQSLFRMMIIMAGLVGFLLTRGLNRFSRQGYRLPKTN